MWINLTPHQREGLKYLFEELQVREDAGSPGCLAGQIYGDGQMRVGILSNAQTQYLNQLKLGEPNVENTDEPTDR